MPAVILKRKLEKNRFERIGSVTKTRVARLFVRRDGTFPGAIEMTRRGARFSHRLSVPSPGANDCAAETGVADYTSLLRAQTLRIPLCLTRRARKGVECHDNSRTIGQVRGISAYVFRRESLLTRVGVVRRALFHPVCSTIRVKSIRAFAPCQFALNRHIIITSSASHILPGSP